ncbi:unnamed protein product [Clonostachys rosea]|uniref:Glycine zipper 2TM domain-containing protein n=1 Tax=Bionectria ochroleuca TaxID=29856 RepID=A0ABY6U0Y4_BIOOC|nr:unnamed protein product [Clonostachys rosea]
MSNNENGGLLGGLLGGVDNLLTGGEQAQGQGGLLGGVVGAVGSTTQGLGNTLGQTTAGVGRAVGDVGNTVGGTVNKEAPEQITLLMNLGASGLVANRVNNHVILSPQLHDS